MSMRTRIGLILAILAFGACRAAETGAADSPQTFPETELVKLAGRAEAAMAGAGATPGREFANRLRSEHRPAWLDYFKGKGPKPAYPSQDEMVKDLETIIGLINVGITWPEPGAYRIPRAIEAPVIDGKLDEAAWRQAAVWTNTYPFNKTEEGGPRTVWRVLWDESYLYFAFDCADPDVVAPPRARDDHVYFDDCVEMFILPDIQFRAFWEIVIAPDGSLFDSVNCKDAEKWGSAPDVTQNVTGLRHAQAIRGTLNMTNDVDEGYVVEVAVPFSALPGYTRCAPKSGDRLHFMLARMDRSSGQFKAYSFRPLLGWGHNIWNHAVIELKAGEAKEGKRAQEPVAAQSGLR